MKIIETKDIINIGISLGVTIGLYYLYVLFKETFPLYLLPVMFMLILIFLEIPGKKN
jgi:hypothetical protein